jgi:hypothetical protein
VNSWLAVSFAEESLRANSRYSVFLSQGEPRRDETLDVDRFPERGFGRFIPSIAAVSGGDASLGGQSSQ